MASTPWSRLVQWWQPYSERSFVVFTGSVVHIFSAWLPCFFFYFGGKKIFGYLAGYELPRERMDMDPTLPANVSRDRWAIFEMILGSVLFVPSFLWFLFPFMKSAKMDAFEDPPSFYVTLKHTLIMIMGCDTMFYWIHRAMHHPLLYKYHKKHHEYKATNVWATEYFDVIDLLANILPGVVPGVLIGAHFQTLLLFTALRGYQSTQSHSGYDIPYDVFNIGPFWGSVKRHDFHHSHNMGCYGDFTPFWDTVCGTRKNFDDYWATRQNGVVVGEKTHLLARPKQA